MPDYISENFGVSRSVAKEMLHNMLNTPKYKYREEIENLRIKKPEKFYELGGNEMNTQVLEILDKLIEEGNSTPNS